MRKVPGKQREAGRVLEGLRRESQGEKWEVDERLSPRERKANDDTWKTKWKGSVEKNGRQGGESAYKSNLKISQGK